MSATDAINGAAALSLLTSATPPAATLSTARNHPEPKRATPPDTVTIGASSGAPASSSVTPATARIQAPAGVSMIVIQTVFPGGSMTTTMSPAEFQAALSSSDPDALGDETSSDGDSWNVKDMVKQALGLTSAAAAGSSAQPVDATGHVTGNDTADTVQEAVAASLLELSPRSDPGRQSDGTTPADAITAPPAADARARNGASVTISLVDFSIAASSASSPSGALDLLA